MPPADTRRSVYDKAPHHERKGGVRETAASQPNDAGAQAGKAQAGLFARAAVLDPQSTLAAANGSDDLNSQLAAADVEMITGQVEAAFARLIGVVKRSFRDERNQARVRLLELFETLGNSDERVLNAPRDLMTALF
jgi:putative thioredoxin